MHKYEITLYWNYEDQTFIAEAHESPGCMAHGDDQKAALRNVKDAMLLWIERAGELGRPIPQPKDERLMLARRQGPSAKAKPDPTMLKLRCEPDLDFQLQAVDAVCDLFRGQEICRTEFTVTRIGWTRSKGWPSRRTISASATG